MTSLPGPELAAVAGLELEAPKSKVNCSGGVGVAILEVLL